jgi:hypothetical protein
VRPERRTEPDRAAVEGGTMDAAAAPTRITAFIEPSLLPILGLADRLDTTAA